MAFPYDEVILTTEGYTEIGELINKPFSVVMGDGTYNSKGTIPAGEQLVYLLCFSNRTEIMCTEDTKLWTPEGIKCFKLCCGSSFVYCAEGITDLYKVEALKKEKVATCKIPYCKAIYIKDILVAI